MNCFQRLSNKYLYNDGKSDYVIYLVPYTPFYDNAPIDSYYFVSNKTYHESRDLIKCLSDEYQIKAVYNQDLNLKKAVIELGIASFGRNSLCYYNEFGSRFFIGSLKIISGDLSKIDISSNAVSNIGCELKACKTCSKCINACPTNAITSNGLEVKKCLRYQMECGEIADKKSMGTRVLGCDICQRACPHNIMHSHKEIESPYTLSKIDDMINNNDLTKLKKDIGSNMARKNRLKLLLDIAKENN